MTGPNVASLRVDRLCVTQEITTLVLGADIGKNKYSETRKRRRLEDRTPNEETKRITGRTAFSER